MTAEPKSDKTPFDLWINGNEGRLQLDATFRTGRMRMRVEALGAAFAAGQRFERKCILESIRRWDNDLPAPLCDMPSAMMQLSDYLERLI